MGWMRGETGIDLATVGWPGAGGGRRPKQLGAAAAEDVREEPSLLFLSRGEDDELRVEGRGFRVLVLGSITS
jgi:hypothetical protein